MRQSKITEPGIIGIDAGGTYTDLVFLKGSDYSAGARAKTPTIHRNLVKTIETGLDVLMENIEPRAIRSFNLATTLATNAIVENRLRPTALILIGYDEAIVKEAAAQNAFNTEHIVMVKGGHNERGDEQEPLDQAELREKLAALPQHMEAAAVSGFFSVRNPSHENRAVELIREVRPELCVSCGHDLTTDLDAMKRATTTVLNAGLIPIVMELLESVEKVCRARDIQVPVTVVRGDGTIVGAPWAKLHPVEMILSGPAASACGARFLASAAPDKRGTWVVDMGGTTTDMIRLDGEGKPVLLEEGATVAHHKTLVKAIDIHTFGLGGDTRVLYNEEHLPELGSRRVTPLCVLACQYPRIRKELEALRESEKKGEPLFLLAGTGQPEDDFEREIISRLKDGPHSRANLLAGEQALRLKYRRIEKMEQRGLVQFASFTPTDALHVLELLDMWDKEASLLGAELMTGKQLPSAQDVAAAVRTSAVKAIGTALIEDRLAASGFPLLPGGEGKQLIRRALSEKGGLSKNIHLMLDATLIGAGAPSWAFMPLAGEWLGEETILPEHGDIAGAVGAAAGSFSLVYSIRITPLKGQTVFRVHYPAGISDFDDLEKACDFACSFMEQWMTRRAWQAGAKYPKVKAHRTDKKAVVSGGREIYVYTQLSFQVVDDGEPEGDKGCVS